MSLFDFVNWFSDSKKACIRRKHGMRPQVEGLEGRDIPAHLGGLANLVHVVAPPAANAVQAAPPLSNGVLTIKGSNNADTIRVIQNTATNKIWVTTDEFNGAIGSHSEYSVDASRVNQIKIYGYDKSDTILVNVNYKSVFIDAGAGNDLAVLAGPGAGTILGGTGEDWLFGNGDDVLKGDGDGDYLFGTAQTDDLQGGAGIDYISRGEMPMAVALKWRQLGGRAVYGSETGNRTSGAGFEAFSFSGGQVSHAQIYLNTRTNQAFAVFGAISAKYAEAKTISDVFGNNVRKILGSPTSDERAVGKSGRVSHFQNGDIYYSFQTGNAAIVIGSIRAKYASFGGPTGTLGLPLHGEVNQYWGSYQRFQNGTIFFLKSTMRSYVVHGAVHTEMLRLAGIGAPVGLPKGDVTRTLGGKFVGDFTNARIISDGTAKGTTVQFKWTDPVGAGVKTVININGGSTAEAIRKYLDARVPKIGNQGSTTITRLTLDQKTGKVECTFAINASHSWGNTPTWLRVLGFPSKLEFSGSVTGSFTFNYRSGKYGNFSSSFAIPVGGKVGEALGKLGWDRYLRFTIDAKTIDDVKTVLKGDLSPIQNAVLDRVQSGNDYATVKARYPSAAWFSSQEFVKWAGPETLVRYGAQIGATAGAGASAVLSEAYNKLSEEATRMMQDPTFQKRAGAYAASLKNEIVTALMQRRDVDLGHVAIKWTTVKYYYGVGSLQTPVQHLAFAIILK